MDEPVCVGGRTRGSLRKIPTMGDVKGEIIKVKKNRGTAVSVPSAVLADSG